MRKEFYKRNKGITLIILVITIILMVIIAGIIVNFASDGRIIDSAKDVVNKTENQVKEQEQMANDVRSLYR